MSQPTVDQKAASAIFREAIAIAKDDWAEIPVTEWDAEIKTIIQGKHLTFRYVLVTALLGKATNLHFNDLALQAGAVIEGAYDARSLCHGVVVPFERQFLNRSLGASNEPFLNKPARFPTISPSNAVRAGKDRALLLILYKVLSEVETSEQAFNGLCTAVRSAIARQTDRIELFPQPSESPDSHLKVIEFVEAFVTKSIEGQVAALIVGTILSLYVEPLEGFEVIIHPVNQSGASSNEVADIDIKKNEKIFVAVEVKDKVFNVQDVDHSAFKAHQYGLKSLTFIIGVHGACVGSSLENVAQTVFQEQGVNVIFVDLISFVKSLIALCPSLSFTTFFAKLQDCATTIRVKDDVLEHLNRIFISQSSRLGDEPRQ